MKSTSKGDGKSITAGRPIEGLIHIIRGQKVMFDGDLAALYEVPTKVGRTPKPGALSGGFCIPAFPG